LRKIYFAEKHSEYLPIILTLVIMTQLPLLDFDTKLNTLVRKNLKDTTFEPNFMVVGIIALLNQYHRT
jgi:WASH complex subunit strumpellin